MSESSVLDRLKSGIRRFQSEIYPSRREAYERAAREPQRPHTLLITCADSRIDPEAVTQAGPGEVFVTRNIGNMVPVYGDMHDAVSAVIEYAISALKVQHVVVCGHSDCGAMKGVLNPDAVASLPNVKSWLGNGPQGFSATELPGNQPNGQSRTPLSAVTEQNVLLQLQHLKTHPSVAGALARGEISLSGWVYEIGTAEVRIAENGHAQFIPISSSQAAGELAGHPVA